MAWTHNQVILKGRVLLSEAGLDADPANFLEFANSVTGIIKEMSAEERSETWVRPFVEKLKELEGDFTKLVEKDPMMLYLPAHEVAMAFHKSLAKVRYNCSANRTSKSQTGYAEHYLVVTGQHSWRYFLPPPASTFVIGVNFSKYAPAVFERKLVHGEPGNILAPMFPVGGKWFYHYNDRKHVLTIACQECAESGKAESCKHPKSTITLFSDQEGPDVLQGRQDTLGHFDEHVSEPFFDEGMERLKSVDYSSMIITGTPLLGKSSWEYRRLVSLFNKGIKHNRIPGTENTPFVSMHTIDQYSAGLVKKVDIDATRLSMDPMEQEARIFGRPAPLAKSGVFDRYALHEFEQNIKDPNTGYLDGEPIHGYAPEFKEHRDGLLRVWEPPESGQQYIIGADVSAGLTGRDYSCASVLSIPEFKLVSQWHGWLNPLDYAIESAKLGRWYNMALLVPERTGGLGVGMIQRLKEIGYYNLFRDQSDGSSAEPSQDSLFGVDTNIRTKGQMVACLQQVIREREIIIHCAETLEELRAYGQEITDSGLTTRFRGEGGTNDDRVMSLVVAVYVAVTYPWIYNIGPTSAPREYNDRRWRELHDELEEASRKKYEDEFGMC